MNPMEEMLRRRQLQQALGPTPQGDRFARPPTVEAPPAPPPTQGPSVGPEIRALIEALSAAPGREAYQTHLGERPQQEDFKPGIGRILMSILAGGIAGPQAGGRVGGQIAHGPFRKAMGKWEREGTGLGQVAGMERQTTTDQLKGLLGLGGIEARTESTALRGRRRAEDVERWGKESELRGERHAESMGARRDSAAALAEHRGVTERGTAAGRAETKRYHGVMENKPPTPRSISAVEKRTATDMAIADYIRDNPDHEGAFEKDATQKYLVLKSYEDVNHWWSGVKGEELSEAKYEEIKQELEDRARMHSSSTRGGASAPQIERYDMQGNPIP